MKLTKGQIKVLQAHIQEELRRRCFPCVVSVEEVKVRDENKIQVTSTKFNTIPVLHSEIEIIDFGSGVTEDETNPEKINVYVNIHASYEGNGVELFQVSGVFIKGEYENEFSLPRFYSDN